MNQKYYSYLFRGVTVGLIIISQFVIAQVPNLVPNGGFEDYNPCPITLGNLDNVSPWSDDTFPSSCEYHNSDCQGDFVGVPYNWAGYQWPKEGKGYISMYCYQSPWYNAREYAQAPLTSTLLQGQCYYFEMWVSRSNESWASTTELSMYMSDVLVAYNPVDTLPYTPTISSAPGISLSDTLDWMKIAGAFTAVGNEAYIVIGSFYSDSTNGTIGQFGDAYYYIDKVLLTPLENIILLNNLGKDTTICEDITLSIGLDNATYTWQDGSTADTFLVTTSGTYIVDIEMNGCTVSDSIIVTYHSGPPVDLGTDQFICPKDITTINAFNASASTYLWQDGSTGAQLSTNQPETYWVVVTDTFGCNNTDTIQISEFNTSPVDLGNDTVICYYDSIQLVAGGGFVDYLWQNGESAQHHYTEKEGIYWVETTDVNGCKVADSVKITHLQLPDPMLGNDTVICEGYEFIIDASDANAIGYLWQDGSSDTYFKVTEQGIRTVIVTNICGDGSDSISVEVRNCECDLCVPDGFSPDGNGIAVNDRLYVFDKLGYKGDAVEIINFKVFNRWGDIVFEAIEASQIIYPQGGWDGTHIRSGKKLEVGGYVWLLEAETTMGNKIGPLSGNVSLFR